MCRLSLAGMEPASDVDVETPHGTVATALVLPGETEGRSLRASRFTLFPSFSWLDQSKQSQSTPMMPS